MIPNIIVSISAPPKSGKTHLALTFPKPLKVYSFDGKADLIRRLRFPDDDITVQPIEMPIIENDKDTTWAPPVWDEFYASYKEDAQSGKYRTLVIDTASTMHTILMQAVFEWVKEESTKERKKMAISEYSTRNLLMKAVIDLATRNGLNLVLIQYLTEKWVKMSGKDQAEPTGEMKIQGWGQTEGFADVNIEMSTQIKMIEVNRKPQKKTQMIATIKSNAFDRDLDEESLVDTTYDELVALMFGG